MADAAIGQDGSSERVKNTRAKQERAKELRIPVAATVSKTMLHALDPGRLIRGFWHRLGIA